MHIQNQDLFSAATVTITEKKMVGGGSEVNRFHTAIPDMTFPGSPLKYTLMFSQLRTVINQVSNSRDHFTNCSHGKKVIKWNHSRSHILTFEAGAVKPVYRQRSQILLIKKNQTPYNIATEPFNAIVPETTRNDFPPHLRDYPRTTQWREGEEVQGEILSRQSLKRSLKVMFLRSCEFSGIISRKGERENKRERDNLRMSQNVLSIS